MNDGESLERILWCTGFPRSVLGRAGLVLDKDLKAYKNGFVYHFEEYSSDLFRVRCYKLFYLEAKK